MPFNRYQVGKTQISTKFPNSGKPVPKLTEISLEPFVRNKLFIWIKRPQTSKLKASFQLLSPKTVMSLAKKSSFKEPKRFYALKTHDIRRCFVYTTTVIPDQLVSTYLPCFPLLKKRRLILCWLQPVTTYSLRDLFPALLQYCILFPAYRAAI